MAEELVLGIAKKLQATDHGGWHTWESCDQSARDRALRQAADIVESTGLAAKDARIEELESEIAAVTSKANELPGLSAELDELRWRIAQCDDGYPSLSALLERTTTERDTALKRVAELEALAAVASVLARDSVRLADVCRRFREAHPGALTELPVSEFASLYPTLTALLGPQLEEMERVVSEAGAKTASDAKAKLFGNGALGLAAVRTIEELERIGRLKEIREQERDQ